MAQSVKRVVGLKNLGNTCYLNSVLQSLASSSSLRKYLEYGRSTHGKQPLTEALHETLEELNNQCAQVHAVEPPRSLLRVAPISAMLNTKEQQDAHELMQLIMNILDDEHSPHVSSGLKSLTTQKNPSPPRPPSILRPNPLTSPIKQSFPTFVNRAKGEVELVKLRAHQENPFFGLMATTKKCTSCGSESLPHYQKFYGITLSIPENQCTTEECTLYKCLDRFTTQMVEDVEWVHQRTTDAHSPPSPANPHLSPQPSLVAGYATFEPAIIAAALPSLPFDSKQDLNLYGSLSCSPPKNMSFTFPKHTSPHRYAILGSSPPKSFAPLKKLPIPPTKPIRSITPPKMTTPIPTPSPSPTSISTPTPTPISPTQATTPTPTSSTTLPVPSTKPQAPTSTIASTHSAPIPIPTRTSSTSNPISIPTNNARTASQWRSQSPPKDHTCASGRCTALLNMTIARPPLSLCLHLRRLVVASRAQPTFIKLDTHIQFPIMLDLASYCGLGIDISSGLSTKPQAPINKLEYRLVAVIVHSGGAYGGHFTVYRRLDSSLPGPSIWANISDDLHTFVDEQKVLESEAYMLYYERERECDEEPIDNASLISNINVQITSGLCFGVQHTLYGLHPTT